jgi:hypothetical protein
MTPEGAEEGDDEFLYPEETVDEVGDHSEVPDGEGQRRSEGKRPRGSRKKKRRPRVTVCMVDGRYDIVKAAARGRGMRLVHHDDDKCNLYW